MAVIIAFVVGCIVGYFGKTAIQRLLAKIAGQ